jgi:dienelactone hydrolase
MVSTGKPGPKIEVDPARALADQPVLVKASGFSPGERVTVRAQTEDGGDIRWESSAVFKAGPSGTVEPANDATVSGSYKGTDVLGIFWSMHPTDSVVHFVRGNSDPQAITLEASGKTGTVSAKLERVYCAEGVRTIPLEGGGLQGTFCTPAGDAPRPGVLLLHGTIARVMEDVAAVLASHGFATAAPLYYGAEGLPPEYMRIPLEYFGTALAWMAARPEVDGDRIAVMGMSRGGELALLVGSRFPTVKAVISLAGSGVVFNGLSANPRDSRVDSPWTFEGKPLPYVERKDTPGFIVRAITSGFTGKPLATLSTYINGLKHASVVDKATIEVEKILGPVLFVSGGRDRVWPSGLLSEVAVRRLEAFHHPYTVRHLQYEGAGHAFGLPYRPTVLGRGRPSPQGSGLDFGGDPAANAHGNLDAWSAVLGFLEESLCAG